MNIPLTIEPPRYNTPEHESAHELLVYHVRRARIWHTIAEEVGLKIARGEKTQRDLDDALKCLHEHTEFVYAMQRQLSALDQLVQLSEGGRWINGDDIDTLVRQLDVALNGAGAAKQARLCDIVAQVTSERWRLVSDPMPDPQVQRNRQDHEPEPS
jgi:hypothetical protein